MGSFTDFCWIFLIFIISHPPPSSFSSSSSLPLWGGREAAAPSLPPMGGLDSRLWPEDGNAVVMDPGSPHGSSLAGAGVSGLHFSHGNVPFRCTLVGFGFTLGPPTWSPQGLASPGAFPAAGALRSIGMLPGPSSQKGPIEPIGTPQWGSP